ncbi:MAG: TlpA family protein disulfide reductase [Candidatus Marinimicrobia bacterium]|nr:TlpA family protein disulfide reductase [Candidatus Neomarinimicrobiota bacterium]
MIRRALTIFGLATVLLLGESSDAEQSTLIQNGQKVPDFSFVTLTEDSLNIRELEGHPVLLNFFATWCPPCKKELPKLEAELWQKYNGKGLKIYCIGRGHNAIELRKFAEKNDYSLPIIPDPDRDIYSLFAEKYIPRNIIINEHGKIIFSETGYNQEKFKVLKDKIIKIMED